MVLIMQEGYLYFVKDEFYERFDGYGLLENKEVVNNKEHNRPCCCVFKFNEDCENIYWMIPISSRVSKYEYQYQHSIEKYGVCDNISFGYVLGEKTAFLPQNLFPITDEYIKNILNDLSNNNSADEAKKVMRACGYQCMSDSLIDTMRTYYVEHNNLDSLIEEMNKRGVGGGNITRDGNTLTASYEQCYCEIDHKNKLPGCYCQCSCGWFEKLFVGILEQPVTVDLEKSIIRGDDECKFIITLSE